MLTLVLDGTEYTADQVVSIEYDSEPYYQADTLTVTTDDGKVYQVDTKTYPDIEAIYDLIDTM